MSLSFVVTEGNRHCDTCYALQKDREHCDILENFHHAEARFASFIEVPLEIGSCVCARDEGLMTGKELLLLQKPRAKMSFLAKKMANSPRVSLRSNVDFAQPWPAPNTSPKPKSPRTHHRRLVL